MNTVEPIRNETKIQEIKDHLKSTSPRDYLLFTMGINSALRIGDLLSLKLGDVLDDHGAIRERIDLRQQKTGKEVRPKINQSIREALTHYLNHFGNGVMDQWLFRSHRTGQRLCKVRVWQLVKQWISEVGLKGGPYGCHSLRKSWGYWARQQGVSLELIMEKLGQSSIQTTRRYIGITQEEVNEIEDLVCL